MKNTQAGMKYTLGKGLAMNDTVIHRLMTHHHPMKHFCYVNNFLKNKYFFMKQFFLKSSIFFLSMVKFWKGLDEFQAWHIVFKSGVFMEFAENCPTTQWHTSALENSQW